MCKKARRHGEMSSSSSVKIFHNIAGCHWQWWQWPILQKEKERKRKKSSGDLMPSVVKKNTIVKTLLQSINVEECVYLMETRWYSAEWGPCINCYQCEMCFSTRCQLTINDFDRKTEVGRGQTPPPFFCYDPAFRLSYRRLFTYLFFFLAVVILSPLPPRFYSFQVKLCNGGPAPTTEGLSGCVQIVRVTSCRCRWCDTQRRDGEGSQTSALTSPEAELWLVSAGGKVRVTVF